MRIFFETLSQEAVKRWHVEREKDRERKGIPGYECGILSRSASFSYVSTGCYLSPSLLRWHFSLSPQRKWEPVWHRRPSEESFFRLREEKKERKMRQSLYCLEGEKKSPVLTYENCRLYSSLSETYRGNNFIQFPHFSLSLSVSLSLSLSATHLHVYPARIHVSKTNSFSLTLANVLGWRKLMKAAGRSE